MYPIYFASYVAAGRSNTDLLWAIALGLPLLAAGILGPWLGALADSIRSRCALLAAMTVASSVATALLVTVSAGDVARGIVLFAFAHVTHLLALSLYNSFLPLIAAPDRFARISGLAWRPCSLGSIACYFLTLPFTRGGLGPANAANFTGAFAVAAVFLALIGLPAVLFLPAAAPNLAARDGAGPYRRILATFREWRRDRNVPKFLLAYYLVNDGIVTATFFTALTFRKSYGMEVQEILALTLVLRIRRHTRHHLFRLARRVVGVAAWRDESRSRPVDRGAHPHGDREGRNGAIAVTVALGLVLGSTQSLFRSMFAVLVPVDRASEYFGFHTLMGRTSAAFGPLAFGIVSAVTGSQRMAMASLALFFITGGAMLALVRLPQR